MAASSESPTGSPSTTLPTEASAKVGPADRQGGAAHTLGPWEAYFVHGTEADAYRIRSKEHPDWSICMGPNWFAEHAAENMANARLIAAAPTMFKALQEVAHHADDAYGFMVDVEAAIAKARGE